MNAVIVRCPKCDHMLGELGSTGLLQSVCSGCHFKFEVLVGKLVGRTSRQITHQRQSTKRSGIYSRQYELRIENASLGTQVVAFEIPGREDGVLVRRGDAVAIWRSMRGNMKEELLAVSNLTTGSRYALAAPGSKASGQAGCAALAIGVIVGVILAVAGAGPIVSFITGVAVLVMGFIYFSRWMAPTHELPAQEEAALAAHQGLLATKAELFALRSDAQRQRDDCNATVDRLGALRDKMIRTKSTAYTERVATLASGLDLLEKQLSVDRQLVEGYDETIAMVEIEIELAQVAEKLDGDVTASIHEKLAELATLRDSRADFEREIEARSELETFLKGAR